MRALRAFAAALALCAFTGAQASPLPGYPLVSTSGKAELWLKPDIGELQFETGSQRFAAAEAEAELEASSAAALAVLARYGVADSDIESFEVTRKNVDVSGQADDGAPRRMVALGRHFTVRVRDLAQWPALVQGVLALDHIDSVSAAFDRSDADKVNRELMVAAAADARSKGLALAEAFGRKLGPATAIARAPLDKLAAPFVEQRDASAPASRTPRASGASSYSVPPSLPFAQAVHAVFRLK